MSPLDYEEISLRDFIDINSPAGSGGEEESVFDPTYGGSLPPASSDEEHVFDPTFGGTKPIVDTGGITNILKKLFVKKDGTLNLQALGAMGGGLAGLLGSNKSSVTPTGFQGKIPKYTAVRNMVTAPPAGRRPGAGGVRYGGDVQYFTKGQVPSQGKNPIAEAEFAFENKPGIAGGGSLIGLPQDTDNNTKLNGDPKISDMQYTLEDQARDNYLRSVNPTYKSDREAGMRTQQPYAQGGLAALAQGGEARYLQGGTDGMSDEIPAQIGENQPAALSHGEFVVPADVVSHLGNGNSDAGARKLYEMMDRIREARTGSKEQGKEIDADEFTFGGLAKAYAQGGAVQRYQGGGITGAGSAANAGVTGTESSLSNWAGEYVTDMLGKGQALSEMPYQQYEGPLTAGASNLQNQAFGGASNLTVPGSVGTAANTAGDIASKAQNMGYTPATFTNQYTAPTPYQPTTFSADKFNAQQAQQYMDPFLQASLNPQLAAARREAAIKQQETDAMMAKSGAFGGGRSAIMSAANNRNLASSLADITGKGYSSAYKNAMDQFNADQSRNMLAQQETEKSRQFGSTQGMTAAELRAKYGQDAARDIESSRQFGSTQGLNSLKTALDAAKAQGDLGISGADLNLRNIKAQGDLGAVQRGIESEGMAADKLAFEEARENPYKMVQFQQSLLKGMPLEAQTINTAQPSTFQQMLSGAGGVAGMFGNKTNLTLDDVTSALKKLGLTT
jgi:hypothetical protein